MKILTTQFTLEYSSLDIYTAGCCGPHCDECHNPESWDFSNGDLFNDDFKSKLTEKIKRFDLLIENIMIFGGEPLDNTIKDVVDLLIFLNKFNKKIWLFTRFDYNLIPNEIVTLCDYIKSGRYVKELKTDNNIQFGIKLSTENQKIFKCR